MGIEPDFAELLAEARQIRADLGGVLDTRDQRFTKRLDVLEGSVNEVFKKLNRPGAEYFPDNTDERKDAIDYCVIKHELHTPKVDGSHPLYVPSPSEVDNALTARKALKSLFRHGNLDRLDNLEKKSLTSFSFGSNQFVLAPQMSNRVLSCLVDPTDVAGLMAQESTSGGSLKFLIDNARMADAAWACEASCFPNNPQPDLQEGLGELEIKCETLRYIVCAGSDLLQDASFNIESWILRKASMGFRNAINRAVVAGDGVGRPFGFLNPYSGIPICDTSVSTTPGQFTWQDLVMLKYEIPAQWLDGSTYFMNQRTFALLLTMSDGIGRPLFGQLPTGLPGFLFAGSPIQIVSWMPNVAPGATPVAFGNWKEAYTVVNRKGLSMLTDPYSAGFCTLFKFEARVGGNMTCPNAARLLRIR